VVGLFGADKLDPTYGICKDSNISNTGSQLSAEASRKRNVSADVKTRKFVFTFQRKAMTQYMYPRQYVCIQNNNSYPLILCHACGQRRIPKRSKDNLSLLHVHITILSYLFPESMLFNPISTELSTEGASELATIILPCDSLDLKLSGDRGKQTVLRGAKSLYIFCQCNSLLPTFKRIRSTMI
jgi:hypothetical protein